MLSPLQLPSCDTNDNTVSSVINIYHVFYTAIHWPTTHALSLSRCLSLRTLRQYLHDMLKDKRGSSTWRITTATEDTSETARPTCALCNKVMPVNRIYILIVVVKHEILIETGKQNRRRIVVLHATESSFITKISKS